MALHKPGAIRMAAGLMVLAVQAQAGGTSDGRAGNHLSTFAQGAQWSCAIDHLSQVQCWYGASGIPAPVGVDDARQVSVSLNEACAVNRHGDVYCWSRTTTPALVQGFGLNGGGASRIAVAVVVNSGIASKPARCALVNNGRVYCWGGNDDGQLGDGTTTDRETPVQVLNVSQAVALYSGSSHTGTLTCAVRLSTGVRCWGSGAATPYAISNLEGARALAITIDGVCLWRSQEGGLSDVICAPPDKRALSNSANFTRIPGLVDPQGIAGQIYGGLCVADAGAADEWKCRDHYYGLDQEPRSGFMTTLPFDSALSFGDYEHSCAQYSDRSLRCMVHGMLVPPCDLATDGAACIDSAGAGASAGTWSLVPNLLLAEKRKPLMFGNTSLQKVDAKTSSSLTISWVSPAQTTEHAARVCNQYGQCTTLSPSLIGRSGAKYTLTVPNLRPNTRYSILVNPSNWASVQGAFGITDKTLP